MKRIRFDINIDVYENGQGIVIKRLKDKKIWGRVFLNEQQKEAEQWIKDVKDGKCE